MALPVSFRWDEDFIERIDVARGAVPRSAWVRLAVERALSEAEGASRLEQASPAPVPSSEGVRLAEPAEQPPRYRGKPGPNVEPIRSYSQAKRGVGPIPKG